VGLKAVRIRERVPMEEPRPRVIRPEANSDVASNAHDITTGWVDVIDRAASRLHNIESVLCTEKVRIILRITRTVITDAVQMERMDDTICRAMNA
jgi:hypothetical protein